MIGRCDAGGRDDDVGAGERACASSSQGTARPPTVAGQRLGVRRGAAGDRRSRRRPALAGAAPSACRSRRRRRRARCRPFEVAENLARQRDGGEADRHRAFAERRSRCARACRRRTTSGTGLFSTGPAHGASARDLERVLHLAEDLRLADDQRIEAGGHAEQVPRGVAVVTSNRCGANARRGTPWYSLRNVDESSRARAGSSLAT